MTIELERILFASASTPRQREVIELYLQGSGQWDIARALKIQQSTVQKCIKSVQLKSCNAALTDPGLGAIRAELHSLEAEISSYEISGAIH
jgi:hypothetical protein